MSDIENEQLQSLNDLLNETVKVFKKDREMAIQNYQDLKAQLQSILDKDLEGSEEYKLEQQMNVALKLVYQAADRLERVVESITKITISQMTNESRERVAQSFATGGQMAGSGVRQPIITGKINIQALLEGGDDE